MLKLWGITPTAEDMNDWKLIAPGIYFITSKLVTPEKRTLVKLVGPNSNYKD